MRLKNGLFSETYPLIYGNPRSFYMQIHYMRAYFWSPYLSHITRSTCTRLFKLISLSHTHTHTLSNTYLVQLTIKKKIFFHLIKDLPKKSLTNPFQSDYIIWSTYHNHPQSQDQSSSERQNVNDRWKRRCSSLRAVGRHIKVSISSTFYFCLFQTKVFCAAFLYTVWLCNFLMKRCQSKSCS